MAKGYLQKGARPKLFCVAASQPSPRVRDFTVDQVDEDLSQSNNF
jgi:hypothetical protein